MKCFLPLRSVRRYEHNKKCTRTLSCCLRATLQRLQSHFFLFAIGEIYIYFESGLLLKRLGIILNEVDYSSVTVGGNQHSLCVDFLFCEAGTIVLTS